MKFMMFFGKEENKEKNKKEESVLEKLLRNKISRDCIGVVSSYLHENDLEFVKAAFDKKYIPNIKYKRDLDTEYEVLCEIDWICASEKQYLLRRYTYCVSSNNYMKVLHRIYKYLNNMDKLELFKNDYADSTIKNILDYMFVHDKDNMVDLSDDLYSCGLCYMSNFMIDYMFDTLQIPIDTAYDFYHGVLLDDYTLDKKIEKLEWLYAHKVPLTPDVFADAINEYIVNKLEIVQWLLDHNCPYI